MSVQKTVLDLTCNLMFQTQMAIVRPKIHSAAVIDGYLSSKNLFIL